MVPTVPWYKHAQSNITRRGNISKPKENPGAGSLPSEGMQDAQTLRNENFGFLKLERGNWDTQLNSGGKQV